MTELEAAKIVFNYLYFHKEPNSIMYERYEHPLDLAMEIATRICRKNSNKARLTWAKGCLKYYSNKRKEQKEIKTYFNRNDIL